MTDTTERKALALMNEVLAERVDWQLTATRAENSSLEALCRAIEQHEAFRREVSDAVEEVMRIATKANFACERGPAILEVVSHFILPKPDPLVDACREAHDDGYHETEEAFAKDLRAAIEKRGGKIVWGEG
jgi:phage gpG-like protein